ncbi:response regulator [Oscillatoria sp. CS-180]|uniref:response regulator transcription factor n=1 Tax=Oscillatoria sp. CS-180 TaxID=3021720 RepID=UPI00232E45C6|nr:response regulator [Oscillatoria sp. CS-180]MDB9528533.1 response regulator [Oscillatoria sp. CS-180]
MRTVLVIEDETQTRNVFLKCLEFEGFYARGASNGLEGIELAKTCRPDLVVCDIMMPDMDGYSVLSILRRCQETMSIPLIFLTAKITMDDLRRGMELGADDYLTKPCTVEQFLTAIAARLKRHDELLGRSSQRLQSTSGNPSEIVNTGTIFPEHSKLSAVFEFIEAHFDEAINLKDVAQAAGYSPAYLTNLVQEQTGQSIKRWIIERRMVEARKLLKSTLKPIKQIAELSGYVDAGYFTRQFRQLHGASPQIWRQQSKSRYGN